jgi:6-pyruvoyltetrahydropterin/6-carboxytetrahydropterin synthase
VLPNCSCEGLAQHLFEIFDPQVREATQERAWITEVEIEEDSKNSATFRIQPR